MALAAVLAEPLAQAQQPQAPPPDGDAATEVPPSTQPGAVEPPRLQKFVSAPYPPEARRRGREADVLLELELGPDGSVRSSQVVEPAGHGFDEAAQQAALKFVFTPARRDGRPVAARIHYRYLFRLEPTAAAPPPPTKAKLPARIVGRVVTGTPQVGVAGARVVLVLPGGATRELVTGAEGEWRLGAAPAGRYRIEIQAPGFTPVSTELRVESGTAAEVTDRLEPLGAAREDSLQVTVEQERPAREVTRRTLSQRELATAPGSMGDAIRAVQNLPGVAPTPVGSSQIIVRGTAPEDSLAYIDGLQVLNVYHLWGLSSVVPTEMLDHLELYPGNYSVKYGRGIGGLIDVALREPRPDGRYHGLAQVDLIDARAVLEGPVPALGGWQFIGGVRRSHLDTVAMPLLGWEFSPVYKDYQFFLVKSPAPDSRLRIGLLGADDRLTISSTDDVRRPETDIASGFFYFTADYQTRLSERADWSHTLAVGRIYQRFSFTSSDRDYSVHAPVYPFGARTELGWRLLPRLRLNLGTDLHYAPYQVKLRVPQMPASGAQPPNRTAFDPLSEVDTHELYLRPAAYLELIATPTAPLRIVSGLRIDYSHDTERVDVSPRVSTRYDLIRAPLRSTVKGGVGLFCQPPPPEQVLAGFGTPGLDSSRAIQTSLGFEQQLSDAVEASVEGFAYRLAGLVRRRVTSSGQLELANSGNGHTLGLESLVRVKPSGRFYGWLAYTLSRSMRRSHAGEELALYERDATHVLTALGSYRLGRGWEVDAKQQYVSGNPYTPVVGALYSSSTDSYVPVLGDAQSRRLPAYHELDLRVQKRWQLGGSAAFMAYLDVINVYGRDRVTGIECSDELTRCVYAKHPMPVIPSLGLRGEF